MEITKKTILQALITGTTATTNGTAIIVKPDLNACYHMKIGLKSIVKDIGFFDAYDPETCSTPTTILKYVSIEYRTGGYHSDTEQLSCGGLITSDVMSLGECYDITLCWWGCHNEFSSPFSCHCIDVYCNNISVYSCNFSNRFAQNCSGNFAPLTVRYGDDVGLKVYASSCNPVNPDVSVTSICISNVEQTVGCYQIGDTVLGYRLLLGAQPGNL